jgi:enamidase
MDLAGRSVMPGYVMLHEHLFYPSGGGAVYNEQGYSFPRLYLAGGVTTMRTAGNMAGYADLNIKKAIDEGTMLGPSIDVTAPYLEGPGLPIPQVKALKDANDARTMVNYWASDPGSAQAWPQDHRPSVLRDVPRGRSVRHRRPRAWLHRRQRFRARQEA